MSPQKKKIDKKREAQKLFSPRTPIAYTELFSGRSAQIYKLNGAIAQPGAHVIIYGERGVGKTSLANIAPLTHALEANIDLDRVVAPRIACDSTDTFDSVWRKVFRNISIGVEQTPVGFLAMTEEVKCPFLDTLSIDRFTPGTVLQTIAGLTRQCHLVMTLDEFDRLPRGETTQHMADLIKSLSDNHIGATVVIVGVGDSISQLVQGHESVGRHIVEIPLPRMSRDELEKIVEDRLPKLNMSIDPNALSFISLVSAGLPYYTHLLGQHSVCLAIDEGVSKVMKSHVESAMKKAIEDSEREMKSAYYEATQSRQPVNNFAYTLAACALAQHDEFGFFTAAGVRNPLGNIRGADIDIPRFSSHLERFSKTEKKAVLEQIGQKHQRRYRFRDPLMQPFVIIRSLDDGIITEDHIKESSTSS